jgi:hypothetical protein
MTSVVRMTTAGATCSLDALHRFRPQIADDGRYAIHGPREIGGHMRVVAIACSEALLEPSDHAASWKMRPRVWR